LRFRTIALSEALCILLINSNNKEEKMKIRNLILGLVLIAGISFTGCKKEETNPGGSTGNGSLSLKHAGSAWSATLSVQAVNTNGILNITGSDSNANQAAVTVFQPNGAGTYIIGPSGNTGTSGRWTQGIGQTDTYTASNLLGSGEIKITELTATKVKGSFFFTAYNTEQNTVQVTEGKFDVNF
jgi:hypothetical protein